MVKEINPEASQARCHTSHTSRHELFLQAYSRSADRRVREAHLAETRRNDGKRIASLSPTRHIEAGKFDKIPGAAIAPRNTSPPRVEDRWWEKPPTIAGEKASKVQLKLSNVETFTGLYKHRFVAKDEPEAISGDYVDRPIRAIRMLNSHTNQQLTIPRRAADFRNEVEWRLSLRPQFN